MIDGRPSSSTNSDIEYTTTEIWTDRTANRQLCIEPRKVKMYAELGEDINGSSSFDASAKIEKIAASQNGGIMKGKAIKKSSELRKSLMDDGSGADLESGIVNSSQKKGKSSLMASDDDPYYVFKEDLLIKLDLVEDGLERYERIIKTTVSRVLARLQK